MDYVYILDSMYCMYPPRHHRQMEGLLTGGLHYKSEFRMDYI